MADKIPPVWVLLNSEVLGACLDPLIGILTMDTDEREVHIALNRDGAEQLRDELNTFLEANAPPIDPYVVFPKRKTKRKKAT